MVTSRFRFPICALKVFPSIPNLLIFVQLSKFSGFFFSIWNGVLMNFFSIAGNRKYSWRYQELVQDCVGNQPEDCVENGCWLWRIHWPEPVIKCPHCRTQFCEAVLNAFLWLASWPQDRHVLYENKGCSLSHSVHSRQNQTKKSQLNYCGRSGDWCQK